MPLRISSLNTWGLPLGLARDLPRRTEALGRSFASSGADAIALQEVWTPRARTHLRSAAAEAGFEHAFFVDRSRDNSGLVVFSRHPFSRGEARAYRVRGWAERVHHGDYWSGKGWLDVVLQTPEGELRLVDTHLHAAYSAAGQPDEYAGERMAQVVELAHALRDRALPLLAVGDFNMHEGSDEYRVFLALSGLTDVAAERDERQATIQADHPYGGPGAADERIDYAFARDGSTARLRPVSIRRDFDAEIELGDHVGRYSDHAGLRIEVALEPLAHDTRARAGDDLAPAIVLARTRLAETAATTRRRATRQTAFGTAALVASGALGFAADLRTRGRRSLLRALALGVPALGALAGGATVALGQGLTPSSAHALDGVARLLGDFDRR